MLSGYKTYATVVMVILYLLYGAAFGEAPPSYGDTAGGISNELKGVLGGVAVAIAALRAGVGGVLKEIREVRENL